MKVCKLDSHCTSYIWLLLFRNLNYNYILKTMVLAICSFLPMKLYSSSGHTFFKNRYYFNINYRI